MTPTVYRMPREHTSPRWCKAFARGCGGAEIVDDGRLRPGPVALFGSPGLWDQFEQAQAEGRRYWYGDHGYFGRGEFYRVTAGRLQLDGQQATSAAPSLARFQSHGISIQPWRTHGSHVLICPPDQVFAGLNHFDDDAWLRHTLAELRRHTDRELRVRSRSLGTRKVRPLTRDLADCWCLVTYTSNAAVDSVCAGVPVICTGPCAGRLMGSGDLASIEDPVMGDDRETWAAWLAANQWTMDEMAAGDCWRAIGGVA